MKESSHRAAYSCPCPGCRQHPDSGVARRHRAIHSLLATVDERSRRLVTALLARQQGRGGITRRAPITGLSRNTIRRGLSELAQPQARSAAPVRRPGGGRKRGEKKMSPAPRRPGGPRA